MKEEDGAQAEKCFRKAIEIAQRQEAKILELRDQGRIEEARAMLSAIYGWFTEGFDTPDLVDARALLDELARG